MNPMSDPFSNLHEKTGHTMPEWFALIEPTGLEKHTEIMNWLKTQHGVSHGFANGIALQYRARGEEPTETDLVDAQYYLRNVTLGGKDIRALGGWAEARGDSNVVVVRAV